MKELSPLRISLRIWCEIT